jgi:predicted dehydrogenase
MFEHVRPDVVHILTPPRSHVPLSHDALDAGAHVVVEKPAAADAAELRALYDHADRVGRQLMENQNYRFNDGVVDLAARIDSGQLGELVEIETRLHQHLGESKFADPNVPNPLGHLPGGAIRDYLPHMVGLVLHLAHDPEIVDVTARWRSDLGIDALGVDALDATMATGSMVGRVVFDSRIEPEGFVLAARGTLGTASVDLWQPHGLVYRQRGSATLTPLINQAANGGALMRSAVVGLRDKIMQHLPYHGITRLLDGFYAAVQTGGDLPVSRASTLATAEIIDRMSATAARP